MMVEIPIWSIDTTSCSWEEFKSMIEQKISEQIPGGEVVVSADDDYDYGKSFSIKYTREETPEEKQDRLYKVHVSLLEKEDRDRLDYLRLKRKFDNSEA